MQEKEQSWKNWDYFFYKIKTYELMEILRNVNTKQENARKIYFELWNFWDEMVEFLVTEVSKLKWPKITTFR